MPAAVARLAVGLAAALLLAVQPARGNDALGVLAVAEPPGPGKELALLTDQLRSALALHDAGVVDAAQLRERMEGRPAEASLSELDRAYRGALAADAAGELESAVETLRIVIESLERLPESPEVLSRWSPAMLRLARTEEALGHHLRADGALERLLQSDPSARIEPRDLPPRFASLVRDARERIRAQGTRHLAVRAPSPTEVFVDGRSVGTTPIALDVPPGEHRIAARFGKIRIPAATIDLSGGDQTIDLDLSFAEAQRPEAGPGLALPAAEWPDRIITTAARLLLSRVITASVLRTGDVVVLVGTLYDVRRGTVEREGRIRLVDSAAAPGGVEALAEFMLTGERSSLVLGGAPRVLSAENPQRPPRPQEQTSHRHLGFYFRPGAGVGYIHTEPLNSPLPPAIEGPSSSVEVSVGGAVVENLILALHLWSASRLDGSEQRLFAVGPEFTYYMMPANAYLSLTLVVTTLSLGATATTYETNAGYGGVVALGKEWWVMDHWGLGLAGQVTVAVSPESRMGGPSWLTFGTGLALSATYN